MTEKRFRKGKSILTDFPTGAIIDEKTGERYYDGIKPSHISSKELVKILNELHEENQALKSDRARYEEECRLDVFKELTEENEQLKKRVEYLERKIQKERNATTKQHLKWSDEAETKIKELEEENERLRKENKELEKFRYSVFQKMNDLIL